MRGAFALQKQFVGDAAHELRSPLAALRLQSQALQRAGDPESRRVAEQRLTAGIDRATRLIEQLLSLARHEGAAERPAPDRVDLTTSSGRPCPNAAGRQREIHLARHARTRAGSGARPSRRSRAAGPQPAGQRDQVFAARFAHRPRPDHAGRPRLAHGRRPGPRHRAQNARASSTASTAPRATASTAAAWPGDRPLDRRRPPCLDRSWKTRPAARLARAGGFSRRLTLSRHGVRPSPASLKIP